jgi:Dyp-type peroxidase family
MAQLDFDDIQGIIVRGYGELMAAQFMLLGITESRAARQWLRSISGQLMDATKRPSGPCLNVAFTFEGLRRLGLPEEIGAQFAAEFREGMTTPKRRRVLGDIDANAPEHWQWGGPAGEPIHILLMLYAKDMASLSSFCDSSAAEWRSTGQLRTIRQLATLRLPGRKEHFGFRDGISQPLLRGVGNNAIQPGEIILGYPNEHGEYPASPMLGAEVDREGLLRDALQDPSQKDFGCNGSYLVFRQLEQDVGGFWQCVGQAAATPNGNADSLARTRLASKMVGRWPSGAPLALSPERDDPSLADANTFSYLKDDPDGLKCPIGAHIRRSNPRDSLTPDRGAAESLRVVNGHRIIRRGRSYGDPLINITNNDDIVISKDRGGERGLHFICFNANINRQFEFIQQTWINNPKFDGLYDEVDPLIGTRQSAVLGAVRAFSLPGLPVRRRIHDLPSFITVRGGAYFFMPGRRAVKFLSTLA